MGCDIHMHSEIKIDGEWHHYSEMEGFRNYDIFNKMAGVRGFGSPDKPISEPRGLPEDVSPATRLSSVWDGDVHSHSWLSLKEITDLCKWLREKSGTDRDGFIEQRFFGYLHGGTLWSEALEEGELQKLGIEDARIVFWFDN